MNLRFIWNVKPKELLSPLDMVNGRKTGLDDSSLGECIGLASFTKTGNSAERGRFCGNTGWKRN